MAKDLTLVLRVKNAMQVGLAKAKATLSSFASGVASVGKILGGAFLAGGAALTAFSVKALAAYAVQEKAVTSLKSSFRAFGEEVDLNTQKIEKLAAAIQDETGIADENTIARAARLKLLGVETEALEGALKATIALEAAGMGEEQAVRAIAAAREGDFMMLQRYIPTLRTATGETEKAALLNEFLTKGYRQQADTLNTVSGQWRAFRGRIGDVWEAFGGIIAQNGMIARGLALASEKVKAFGESILQWAASERFQEIQNSIEGIVNAIIKGGQARAQAVSLLGDYLRAALVRGAELAGSKLIAIAPKIGEFIAKGFKAATGAVGTDARRQAGEELGMGRTMHTALGSFGLMENKEKWDAFEARAREIEAQKLGLDIQRESTALTENQTEAQKALADATEALLDLGKKHGQIIVNTTNEVGAANKEMLKVTAKAADETSKVVEERYDTEKMVLDEVVDAHEAAGRDVVNVWRSVGSESADAVSSIGDAVAKVPGSESIAGANSPVRGGSGGTFETEQPLGIPNGTRILTPDSGAVSFTGGSNMTATSSQLAVWDQMARSLKNIEQDQQQLLRYS